jgi:hypothetical protein
MNNLSLLRNHNARKDACARILIAAAALRTAFFPGAPFFSKSTQKLYDWERL